MKSRASQGLGNATGGQLPEQLPLPSPDFSKLANYREIHNYLSVGDADEIARLAANLSPMRARFDASSLVEKAIAIQAMVSEKLKTRRHQILDRMSFPTLGTLAKKLGVTRSALESDPMMFYDPVKGPVAFQLRAWGKVGTPCENATILDMVSVKAEATLDVHDQLTEIKRPEFPCALEELLRYAANDPTTSWGALDAAFKGFLQISSPYLENEEIRDILITESNKRNDLLATLNEYAEGEPAPAYLSQMLADSEKLISMFQEVLDYRNSFSPNRSCPDLVASEAAHEYEEILNTPGQTDQSLILHLSRFNFYSFWQKHGTAYVALDAAKVKAKKEASQTNSKSGQMGAHKVGTKIWTEHTRELIAFCGHRKIPTAFEEREKFLQEFAALRSSHPKTQAKIRGFFGTIWNHLEDDATKAALENISKLLKKEKINNATLAMIGECLKVLRMHEERCGRPDPLAKEGAKIATRTKKTALDSG